jgi:predicted RNase H-like HicB family nuclease
MKQHEEIIVEYDESIKEYFVIWQPPLAIASGKTKAEALQDLQQILHFCIDSCTDA